MADNTIFCDFCAQKGMNEEAAFFCTSCSKRICCKHKESHDVLRAEHHTVMVGRRQKLLQEEEVDASSDDSHPKLVCGVCSTVISSQYSKEETHLCNNGSAHKPRPLEKLVSDLIKEINDMKIEVMNKEDKLSALFEQTSSAVADYENETKELIGKLHKARDKQHRNIQLMYANLELLLVEHRRSTVSQMESLMEDIIGPMLMDISRSKLRIEAALQQSDQVAMVTGHRETINQIEALIYGQLPKLEIRDMMTLEVKAMQKRAIDISTILDGYGVISSQGLKLHRIPKTMNKFKVVRTYHSCYCISYHKGITYVGRRCCANMGSCNSYFGNRGCSRAGKMCDAIERINETYTMSKNFIAIEGSPCGIAVYKDNIYTMTRCSQFKIYVHSLNGESIMSWDYGEKSQMISKFVIINDQIIIPDSKHGRLCLYSLQGEVVKYISCPYLSEKPTHVAMCVADGNAVIISSWPPSRVFKVNISSGEIEWCSTNVICPQGVVCYLNCFVMVTRDSTRTTLWILDIKTGHFLSKIEDPDRTELSSSAVYDLHITGNTLIVPRTSAQLLYYTLR